MRHFTTILTILFLIFFASCNSNHKIEEFKEGTDTIPKNENSLIKENDSLTVIDKSKPVIFLFKQSECDNNCETEKVISKKYSGDTLLLKIGSIQNCIGNFSIDYKINNEILDLKIKIKKKIVKRENGEIDTLMSMALCDCYYYFEIGIKHIDKKFKTILVNGQRLNKTVWWAEDSK